MADIAITAANCVPGANAVKELGVAGEAITAGQAVYKDASTAKWLKADNDSATVAAQHAGGIALTGSSLNQPIVVQTSGDLTLGGTIVAGSPYYLSATAGGVAPLADIVTGKTVCMLGHAKSTTVLNVAIQFPGVTL